MTSYSGLQEYTPAHSHTRVPPHKVRDRRKGRRKKEEEGQEEQNKTTYTSV